MKNRTAELLLRVWRAFRSLKFGLFLLAVIGVCLIRASLISSDPTLGSEAIHEAKNRVYGTGWFLALLILFTIQFIVSTWHVTVMSFGLGGKRVFWRTLSAFDRQPYRAVVERGRAEPEAIEKAVARRCTLFHRNGDSLYGHRGLLSRIGPTGVHAGIVTVLAAGLLWASMDRSGRIITEARWICAEGDTGPALLVPKDRSHALGPGNQVALPIRARIRLLDFDVVNHPHSDEPASFSSVIQIQEPGRPGMRVARVDMNTPCVIDGLIYHQAAYIPMKSVKRAQFDVRQLSTGRRLAVVDSGAYDPVTVDGTDLILEVTSPVAGARWALSRRSAPTHPIAWGKVANGATDGATTASLPTTTGTAGASAPFLDSKGMVDPPPSPGPYSTFNHLDPHAPPNPGDFKVKYLEPAQGYATVLSVISVNPALSLIWTGVFTVFVFALLTFAVRYRQVFGLWDEGRTRLTLALLPHREHYTLQKDFQAILDSIRAAGGQIVEVAIPPERETEVRRSSTLTGEANG